MKFKTQLTIGEGRFDMTPLIDLVFLLNIFFMLSSTFIFQPGIKVKLPESNVSETKKEKAFEVIITQENLIFFESERVSTEGLKRKLSMVGKNFPEAVLIIKADENVLHKSVVKVMDLAKMNGIKKLGIATRPVEQGHEK